MAKHITKTGLEAIASSIKQTHDSWENSSEGTSYRYSIAVMTFNLSGQLAKLDPTFDRDKFIESCGIKIS